MISLETLTEKDLTQAVALYYDGESAPIISASGQGKTAVDIIEIANEHGIPLCDNEELINLLITLELGESIPESLYLSIAYIIALAYDMQGKEPSPSN
ncbi:MAG: EscU/YscU/HrcU family type III secretion system export apparatus switch protein [Cellvibrionaceae bacterium]